MVEKALVSLLTADSLVAGFIANADGTYRIGPHVPQSEGSPFIVYLRIDTPRIRALKGPVGLAHPRMQVECHSPMYDEARNLADAVRQVLDGYPAPNGHTSAGGVTIQGLFVQDEYDLPTPPQQAGDTPWFARALDVICWHEETP